MTKNEIEEVEGGYIVEWETPSDKGKEVVMEGNLGKWFMREVDSELYDKSENKFKMTLGV